jgi:hypothetical protein
MQRKIIFGITIALLLSGCIQFGAKGFSDLKTIIEKHTPNSELVPGTETALQDMEYDLLSLKAIALNQNSPDSKALAAIVDVRLSLIEMERNILNANKEAKFIDYYSVSCSQPTSLKKTIDFFDKAITQAELATTQLNNFETSYKEKISATGLDFVATKKAIANIKTSISERKTRYQSFCT